VGSTISGSSVTDNIDLSNSTLNNSFTGGSGTEVVNGGKGQDTITFTNGTDVFYAFFGFDHITGGSGTDNINLSNSNHETFTGGSGTEVVLGGLAQPGGNGQPLAGGNTIDFGGGTNTYYGQSSNDTINGSTGLHDTLALGSGTDAVQAGSNGIMVALGSGNDTFTGGLDTDTLFGGTGSYTINFKGNDRANLYTPAADAIDLLTGGGLGAGDIVRFEETTASAVIATDATHTIFSFTNGAVVKTTGIETVQFTDSSFHPTI
jgi:serralysin